MDALALLAVRGDVAADGGEAGDAGVAAQLPADLGLELDIAGLLHADRSAGGGRRFDLADIQTALGHSQCRVAERSYLSPLRGLCGAGRLRRAHLHSPAVASAPLGEWGAGDRAHASNPPRPVRAPGEHDGEYGHAAAYRPAWSTDAEPLGCLLGPLVVGELAEHEQAVGQRDARFGFGSTGCRVLGSKAGPGGVGARPSVRLRIGTTAAARQGEGSWSAR